MENPKPERKKRSAPTRTPSKGRAVTFHEPFQTKVPCPPNLVSHLGLDEFCFFDPHLTVRRFQSYRSTSSKVSISKACHSLKKRGKDKSCYTLDLSPNTELDSFIDIPRIVTNHSLFHQHWPAKQSSIFFLPRSKLYYAFDENYESYPYLAYGGLTEWIQVLRGRLSITIIRPTELNLARYECLADVEELSIEPDTSHEYILQEDSFLSIPAGHISIKKAIRATCALGGELLHSDDFLKQLDSFKNDVRRANGRHGFERDAEIRHLYWFYTMQGLVDGKLVEELDWTQFQALSSELTDWAHKFRVASSKADPYMPPGLYAPMGIQMTAILRDVRNKKIIKKSHELDTSQVSDGDQTMSLMS